MAKTWTKEEVGNKNVNGIEVALTDEEKTAIAVEWTTAEKEVEDKIAARVAAANKKATDKAAGNQKLKDLGLTDDEIAAVTGN
jgi:hypothetical protein